MWLVSRWAAIGPSCRLHGRSGQGKQNRGGSCQAVTMFPSLLNITHHLSLRWPHSSALTCAPPPPPVGLDQEDTELCLYAHLLQLLGHTQHQENVPKTTVASCSVTTQNKVGQHPQASSTQGGTMRVRWEMLCLGHHSLTHISHNCPYQNFKHMLLCPSIHGANLVKTFFKKFFTT